MSTFLLGAGAVVTVCTCLILLARITTAVIRAVAEVVQYAHDMRETMAYVKHEMSFNGGSTMRDSVKRIDERLEALEGGRRATDH